MFMEKFSPENKIQKQEGIICRNFECTDHKWELLPLIMPSSVNAQIEIAYAKEGIQYPKEFHKDLAKIHDEVLGVLNRGGLKPIESNIRLKDQKRLLNKFERRAKEGVINPILDVYGISFVFATKRIAELAQQLIEEEYDVPEKFPFGLPTVRTEPNDVSSPGYSVIRMNIVFSPSKITKNALRGFPQRFLAIAEIQLLSETEKENSRESRPTYEKKRGKDKI